MSKQNNSLYSPNERLINGILRENPTFVLVLGMCPTLATTTSAINGLGMGLTTAVVLALSNVIISLLRNVIPDKVRIPAFIVIIASFVTILELLLQGFIPFLYSALGIYIPLIVVNCIILGRAEAFASKEGVLVSFFDGVGMGLGFTASLTIIGAVREILGAGEVFGFHFMPDSYVPVTIFVLAPGAFFVLAMLSAIQNKIKIIGTKKGKDMSKIGSGCSDDCMNCLEKSSCTHVFYDTSRTNDVFKNIELQEEAERQKELELKQTTEAEVQSETEVQSEVEVQSETEEQAEAEVQAEVEVQAETEVQTEAELQDRNEAQDTNEDQETVKEEK